MGISLFNLYGQIHNKTKKGSQQEVIRAIINEYSIIAEASFYQGKKDGLAELEGGFIQTYKDIPIKNDGKYYSDIPSTFVLLPHAMGLKWIGFTGGKTQFWMVSNYDMYIGLKASVMGGHLVGEIEGNKVYFPNMDDVIVENKTITMKLACAYDNIDVDLPLNISPNMAEIIVKNVIALFMPEQPKVNENIR